jgi:flagellar assembly protein FliH
MSNPVKYTFDQAFDGGAKSRYDVDIERIQSEAEAAREEAYAKGVSDGHNKAMTEIESATQETLQQITEAAKALFDQYEQLETSLKQEMVHLSYGIASKLASTLIRSKPTAEVQALIEDCLATVSKEPRLVVRVSETISEEITARIDAMKNATSFAGDIILIGESGMAPLDCRVEWPDGGTERKQSTVQRKIEDAVQRFVMSEMETEAKKASIPTETKE